MTFPVGGLPAGDMLEDLRHRTRPTKSVAFTHAGSDLDLTDPTNGLDSRAATDLFATSTGNLVARLAGDSTERTYPVVAGTIVYGVFVLIKSSSTADCIARS